MARTCHLGRVGARLGLPTLSFVSVREWESWLEANHATSAGIWMMVAKKGSGEVSVGYAQALEAALCFGWIDGQKGALDERFWLQRFTPRGPRSRWSRINRDKAELLIGQDRMRPAGLAAVERAKRDGAWQRAYEGQRDATVPGDLEKALEENPAAAEFFSKLDGANRYAIIYRVGEAKLPATRAKRIAKYVAMLGAGEKLHNGG
jgi:uncharacterized protein YdeI (YjbR/CyaY-like superfamily)